MSTPTESPSPSPTPTASRRAEANRLNAQKSTGPRTPEGKARSAMNALTHGLSSQASLLPGEDPAELEALGKQMLARVDAADPVQRSLAERIVALTWRLRRVATAEAAAAAKQEEQRQKDWRWRCTEAERSGRRPPAGPPEPADAGKLLADAFRETGPKGEIVVDGPLVRITKYEMKLDAALRGAIRELRAAQKDAAQREGDRGRTATALGTGPTADAESAAGLRLPGRGAEAELVTVPVPVPVHVPSSVPDSGPEAQQSATECRAAPHREGDEAPGQIEPNGEAQEAFPRAGP